MHVPILQTILKIFPFLYCIYIFRFLPISKIIIKYVPIIKLFLGLRLDPTPSFVAVHCCAAVQTCLVHSNNAKVKTQQQTTLPPKRCTYVIKTTAGHRIFWISFGAMWGRCSTIGPDRLSL